MSQRLTRVLELLKRELSVILERDFDFQGSLVTVTGVDVTADLKQAFVHVGVIAGSQRPDDILGQLNSRRGFVQGRLSKRVVLKRTPQLSFRSDASSERGVRLVSLMDELGLDHQVDDDRASEFPSDPDAVPDMDDRQS